MKAKFELGFLSGFKEMPASKVGDRASIPILEPAKAIAVDEAGKFTANPLVKYMIFECTGIDDDMAMLFKFVEIN